MNHKRLITIIVSMLLVPTLSRVYAQTSSNRDFPEQAATYFVNCLHERAKQVDDSISDASTISSVIVPLCRTALVTYLRAQAPQSILISELEKPPRQKDIQTGVSIVLQERAARRR